MLQAKQHMIAADSNSSNKMCSGSDNDSNNKTVTILAQVWIAPSSVQCPVSSGHPLAQAWCKWATLAKRSGMACDAQEMARLGL